MTEETHHRRSMIRTPLPAPRAEHTGRFKSASWLAAVVMAFTFVMLGLWIAAQVWPYNNITIDGYGPIQTDERTPDGLPVIRSGGAIRYEVTFCNRGVNSSITDRWIDQLGPAISTNGDTILDAPEASISTAVLFEEREFYNSTVACATTTTETVLPTQIRTGLVYQLRNVTSYEPNALATVTLENSTEPFLLLGPDDPILEAG